MIFSSTVPSPAKNGMPLADYLAGRFTYYSRDEWLKKIVGDAVAVNGKKASAATTVAPGDVVSYDAGEFEEPAADLAYRIVYEDDWLLGIDKPGNLLVHRAGKSFRNNLMYQLRFVHAPPYPVAHAVHRIDRETSGAVLVARSAEARAAFGRTLAGGGMTKQYHAIVKGCPMVQEINLPIGRTELSAVSYRYSVQAQGKQALTRITAVESIGGGHSLVTCEPVTGRTHQIRIHLAAAGAPVVGDKLYGMSEQEYLAWRENPSKSGHLLDFHRQALHCASLSFVHPYTKKPCAVTAPLPADMRELIERLRTVQPSQV